MVGINTGEREEGFHRVKPAHGIRRLLQTAAIRETSDVVVRVFLRADEIAIERENGLGRVVVEHGLDGFAKRLGRRALMHAGINRVIQKPAGLRQLFGNLLAQPATRR